MSLIHIENLSRHFQILNGREGQSGAFCFAFTYVILIGVVSFDPPQLLLRPEDVSSLVYFAQSLALGSLLSPIRSGQRM